MAITPNSMIEDLALSVLGIYQNVEIQILASIAARMGADMKSNQWDTLKLQQVREQQEEVKKILEELDKVKHGTISKAAKTVYARGIQAVNDEFSIKTALGLIDTGKVDAYARAIIGQLDGMKTPILRSSNDIYRRIITQTTQTVITGYETRRQATQKALERFADQGISGYIDTKGRRWTMPSYAEMATRTGLVQANLQGTIDRMDDIGEDLVYVTEHPEECPKCRPWEGKVLSVSGNSTKYPSVDEARSAGLFHARCGHSLAIYVKGITDLPQKTSSPELYEQAQKENYLKRGVRTWEKRAAVSIDPSYKNTAEAKVKEWKSRLKEHQKGMK